MVENIQEKTVENLAEITGYDISDISLNNSLVEDLGLDSMMIMDFHRLITNCFPELEKVNFEEIFNKSDFLVQDIINIIQEKIGADIIPFEDSSIDKFPEIEEFANYLGSQDYNPYFRVNNGIASNYINTSDGSKINYTTYNYLGTNGYKEINNSVMQAIERYGTSVSGSRLLSGETKLHIKLEEKIASFIGAEASLVLVGGHSTNVNIIGNIVNHQDLILHDSLAHNSIIQGSILSHAKRKSFKHNNTEHLESELKKLRGKFRRVLIVAEGVYSMDGDICDLPELIRLKKEYGAILMVDEAHSIGTIGENGRGVTSHYNIDPKEVDILMGTLSKSLNSCGGYIAGSYNFVNYLKYNSPGFIFSVGMTPANAAAAYTSLELCERDNSLVEKLKTNSDNLLRSLNMIGADTGNSQGTPIIPMIIGSSDKALHLSKELYQNGVNVMPIVYPAVKEDEARLRFFVSALHTEQDIDYTVNIIKSLNTEVKEEELV